MNITAIIYWFSEAATVFVNGFISGLPAGGAGGGIAGATTADSQSAVYTAVSIAGINAGKHVLLWHANGHPFPNPFPQSKATDQSAQP